MAVELFAVACMLLVTFSGVTSENCYNEWQTVPVFSSQCTNKHKKCETWANSGECDNTPKYMYANCCAACSPCRNLRKSCPRPNQCAKSDYMKRNCARNCGYCKVTTKKLMKKCYPEGYTCSDFWDFVPISRSSCQDKHVKCKTWAKAGECDNNPSYMYNSCCLSCNPCQNKGKRCPPSPNQCARNAYMEKNCAKNCGFCKFSTMKKERRCYDEFTNGCKSLFPGSVITASSQMRYFEANKVMKGGWCASKRDKNQFLQIDLGSEKRVKKLSLRGINTNPTNFVKSFKLAYFRYGRWNFHSEYADSLNAQVFRGNKDSNTPMKYDFTMPIRSRYVRIYPQEWQNYICMRLELYSCGL